MAYTVIKGDTLWALAQKWGTTVKAILAANPSITNPDLIRIGQVLQQPGTTSTSTGTTTPTSTPTATPAPAPKGIPVGSSLVKVDGQYRVVWGLGSGNGYAWYSVSSADLQNLYGTTSPVPTETFTNPGAFSAKYGDFYWGSIAEVNQASTDPWQDSLNQIYSSFGFVAGMDSPEIKSLLTQAWFEDWTMEQFVVQYKNTGYYQATTEGQRAWIGKSEEEKRLIIEDTAAKMAEAYKNAYGSYPAGGLNEMRTEAERIASGASSYDAWIYNLRTAAGQVEGSPEFLENLSTEQAKGQPTVDRENLVGAVEDLWRTWVGPGPMPTADIQKWAEGLFMNTMSQEEIEDNLKSIGQSVWVNKPPEVSWTSWSAPWRGQIQNLLEVGTVSDEDPLLGYILESGLTGREAALEIRKDHRFRDTNRYRNQLTEAVSEMGRMFGFEAQ